MAYAEDGQTTEKKLPPGYVESIDAYVDGKPTANALGLAAEYCIRNEKYDQAIKYCQKALDKDWDDADTHKAYAEALEMKYNKDPDQDPKVFNRCVKEWLIVLRNEAGEERGSSWHGLSIMGNFYDDEERQIPARFHLIGLTGRIPKAWETDDKYCKAVFKETTNVSGKILAKAKLDKPDDAASQNATVMAK